MRAAVDRVECNLAIALRSRRLEINALQREHADLGRRAARRGKTANLTAGRQDPVAGNKQRDRIFGHRLTDIARSLWPGAEFLRQSAIGRCVAPSDPPRRRVDLLEERVLPTEVEPEAGKIRLLGRDLSESAGASRRRAQDL